MNRRSFVQFCAALPLVGWLVPKPAPAIDADKVEKWAAFAAKIEAEAIAQYAPLATRLRKLILEQKPGAVFCSRYTWQVLHEEIYGEWRPTVRPKLGRHFDGVRVILTNNTKMPFGIFACVDQKQWSFTEF